MALSLPQLPHLYSSAEYLEGTGKIAPNCQTKWKQYIYYYYLLL
jgi:hypothetical protein